MIEKLKNFIARFSRRTLIIAASAVLGILIISIVVSLMLNGKKNVYSVLFSKMSQEDTASIISLLSENKIEYKYEDDGDLLVKKSAYDKAMALVASTGYPVSGFAYEIAGKANNMATDSMQRKYQLYDLQDRIAATIRMFDGVQDAKVTIALSEESRYVLTEDDKIPATASVFVRMKDGGSPSMSQVAAIQRFLSASIRGVNMENVAVIDGNGNDVSVISKDGEKQPNSAAMTEEMSGIANVKSEMEKTIEKSITDNVLEVFTPIYGKGNVFVVAKAKVNMTTIMKESVTYSVPDKIDQNDKQGIVSRESASGGKVDGPDTPAEGVVGTEANAEIPEYNAQDNQEAQNLRNYEFAKEYLVNQIKEQGSIPAGAIEDLSVSVSLNAENYNGIPYESLVDLAGNAAGIPANERTDKITIVSAKYKDSENDNTASTQADKKETKASNGILDKIPFYLWAILGALVAIIIFLIVFFALRRQRMLRELQLAAIAADEESQAMTTLAPIETQDSEYDEEKIMIQNDRGMGLRKDVREFADKNPEIAARLLKTWLSGGEENA